MTITVVVKHDNKDLSIPLVVRPQLVNAQGQWVDEPHLEVIHTGGQSQFTVHANRRLIVSEFPSGNA